VGENRVALILCSYKLLGLYDVSDYEKNSISIKVPVEVGPKKGENEIEAEDMPLLPDDHFECLPTEVSCTKTNRLCRMNGLFFDEEICVCDAFPVEGLILKEIAEQCWFVDRSVSDMTNRQKRCLTYWWYATNVYSRFGKKNRMVLPNCLVARIRAYHPSPKGSYVGHKRKGTKKALHSRKQKKVPPVHLS
jgi:hypothetical protein